MSLIRDIDTQPTKRRVVAAIATLCRELGGRVVAEGVETGAELTVLIEDGDRPDSGIPAREARARL